MTAPSAKPIPILSPDTQQRIADLRATRPYDGRRVTLRESRGGWKFEGLTGTCMHLAADHHYMVLKVEHDPEEYWPVDMEILAELDDESVPAFHVVHCIDDKANGIVLNHDADWSGEVRLAWYIADERVDPGPTPPSLRECWCLGIDLVAGRFSPVRGSAPPVDVITRAVALAVETYLRGKMARAVEDLLIDRGAL